MTLILPFRHSLSVRANVQATYVELLRSADFLEPLALFINLGYKLLQFPRICARFLGQPRATQARYPI